MKTTLRFYLRVNFPIRVWIHGVTFEYTECSVAHVRHYTQCLSVALRKINSNAIRRGAKKKNWNCYSTDQRIRFTKSRSPFFTFAVVNRLPAVCWQKAIATKQLCVLVKLTECGRNMIQAFVFEMQTIPAFVPVDAATPPPIQ